MTLDFTKGKKTRQPLKRWHWIAITFVALLSVCVFYMLSATRVVVNGTTSLPHNGYLMVTWPKMVRIDSYVAFDAPDEISDKFEHLVFIKRVVGVPGDLVTSNDGRVCVNAECRTLLPEMAANGYAALPAHVLPAGQFAAFGDASDSLDSRYAAIGTVKRSQIVAVGYPISMPHWKELGTWLGTF